MPTIGQSFDCSTPSYGEYAFKSMGDIRRASKDFCVNQQNPQARDTLNAYRKFRLDCVQTSLSLLKKSDLPEAVLVSARLKRLKSIHRKMRRNPERTNVAINEMDDIIGFRIVCRSLKDAVGLGQRVKENLEARMKNYLETEHGARLGYRAIHGIVRFEQPLRDKHVRVRFEIQIRTWYQHLWACWCESYGEQAKEGFRGSRKREDDIRKLILELNKRSHEIRDWEESHREYVQEELPCFSGPHNLALAWSNAQREYNFDSFGGDIPGAVRYLNYLESRGDVDPLLLVGISETPHLRKLLRRTHPNFMRSQSLDPQYWMPGKS